ncbi:hypothetical protein AQJ91_07880 [Streptomyces dysideae]|uniref:Uncharacterized protein n=1 Tax=Streptomyces dysideae TaxID=909626 RepID=A0A101V370_9ACTN|nr:hypothetical protein AQJ91_07880 [Streptomyces dysideae]
MAIRGWADGVAAVAGLGEREVRALLAVQGVVELRLGVLHPQSSSVTTWYGMAVPPTSWPKPSVIAGGEGVRALLPGRPVGHAVGPTRPALALNCAFQPEDSLAQTVTVA